MKTSVTYRKLFGAPPYQEARDVKVSFNGDPKHVDEFREALTDAAVAAGWRER